MTHTASDVDALDTVITKITRNWQKERQTDRQTVMLTQNCASGK